VGDVAGDDNETEIRLKEMKRIRLTIKEVAAATGLSKQTIRRLANDGTIPCLRGKNKYRLFNPSVVTFLRERYIKERVAQKVTSSLKQELAEIQKKLEKLCNAQLPLDDQVQGLTEDQCLKRA